MKPELNIYELVLFFKVTLTEEELKTKWREFIKARNKLIKKLITKFKKRAFKFEAENENALKEAIKKVAPDEYNEYEEQFNGIDKLIQKLEIIGDNTTNLTAKSGLGAFRATRKMGIVNQRLKWCHHLEQLYLIKHSEIINLGLYISLILNHLYIIHYIFNQIIQIINVKEGGDCPGVPSKVVLPPSYQTIIQKYFQISDQTLNSIVYV